MTFEQYYTEVINEAGGFEGATRKHIRILWGYGYSVQEAINSITSED